VTKGAFNLDCSTTRQPHLVMQDLQALIPSLALTFRQVTPFCILCTHTARGLSFEVEITQYEETDFLYVIRFKKVATQRRSHKDGLEVHLMEDKVFRETTACIIQKLKL